MKLRAIDRVCLLTSCLVFYGAARADSAVGTWIVDLALQAPGTNEEQTVQPDLPHRLSMANMMPGRTYRVSTRTIHEVIPPLPLELVRGNDICESPEDIFDGMVGAAGDESAVRDTIEKATAAVAKQCTPEQKERLARHISGRTTRLLDGDYVVSGSRSLEITIQRMSASGDAVEKEWRRTYSSGARGEWRASYGFNFMPDSDEEYFAAQNPADPTTFVVTQEADRDKLDFAPSVFFSWLSAGQRGKNLTWSPVAGLGFDLDHPIVFAGVGATYNENVMFTVGAVFQSQKRLAGRFAPGQIIGEDLDPAQLQEDTYALNAYFGVAFRFSSNPHKKASDVADTSP